MLLLRSPRPEAYRSDARHPARSRRAVRRPTGERTRKGRNLARDPRCTLSLATDEFDLVLEGDAAKVTDPARVAELAAIWADEWPCRVDESGIALTAEFSAPSAGPPPWHVYRVTARRATVLQTVEPGGASTFTFATGT